VGATIYAIASLFFAAGVVSTVTLANPRLPAVFRGVYEKFNRGIDGIAKFNVVGARNTFRDLLNNNFRIVTQNGRVVLDERCEYLDKFLEYLGSARFGVAAGVTVPGDELNEFINKVVAPLLKTFQCP